MSIVRHTTLTLSISSLVRNLTFPGRPPFVVVSRDLTRRWFNYNHVWARLLLLVL